MSREDIRGNRSPDSTSRHQKIKDHAIFLWFFWSFSALALTTVSSKRDQGCKPSLVTAGHIPGHNLYRKCSIPYCSKAATMTRSAGHSWSWLVISLVIPGHDLRFLRISNKIWEFWRFSQNQAKSREKMCEVAILRHGYMAILPFDSEINKKNKIFYFFFLTRNH